MSGNHGSDWKILEKACDVSLRAYDLDFFSFFIESDVKGEECTSFWYYVQVKSQ